MDVFYNGMTTDYSASWTESNSLENPEDYICIFIVYDLNGNAYETRPFRFGTKSK